MEKTESIEIKYLGEDIINKLCQIDSSIKEIPSQYFAYGTSGFRYKADILEKVAYRTAVITCLLSMSKNSKPYGIMLTASHNLYLDNGVKIAGDRGEMLSDFEEPIVTDFINSKDIKASIENVCKQLKITQHKCIIALGIDTRPSGKTLSELMIKAFGSFPQCQYKFYGVITTPCLHFLTFLSQLVVEKFSLKEKMLFPPESEYWNYLSGSYQKFNEYYDNLYPKEKFEKYTYDLNIDCSNGTVAYHKDKVKDLFKSSKEMKITFINTDHEAYEKLNNKCGAEFVHKDRKYPEGIDITIEKHVSFDGDVDRILYYPYNKEKTNDIEMLNGDKTALLLIKMLDFLTKKLSTKLQNEFMNKIKIALVTTAYTNGQLFLYIKENYKNIDIIITKTGVKFLQKEAKKVDISILAESSGHGGICLSDAFVKKYEQLGCYAESSKDIQVLELIQLFLNMFNPADLDALSTLIAVESSLRSMDMSLEEAMKSYTELFALNTKLVVKDKNIFVPCDNETKLIKPIDVQNKIDEFVGKVKKGRCFVRPSGTEDVVRIYAEADSKEEAEKLDAEIKSIIEKY